MQLAISGLGDAEQGGDRAQRIEQMHGIVDRRTRLEQRIERQQAGHLRREGRKRQEADLRLPHRRRGLGRGAADGNAQGLAGKLQPAAVAAGIASVQHHTAAGQGNEPRRLQEPRRAQRPRRQVGGPVEGGGGASPVRRSRRAACGRDDAGHFRRRLAAIAQQAQEGADLHGVRFPALNQREGVLRLLHGERARIADAAADDGDVFRQPPARVVLLARPCQLPGKLLRRRLVVEQQRRPHRQRRRLHQRTPLPAFGRRSVPFGVRAGHLQKRLRFGGQRPQALPQRLRARRRHQSARGAHQKPVAIHGAGLGQHAAHGGGAEAHARRRPADAAFHQQAVERDQKPQAAEMDRGRLAGVVGRAAPARAGILRFREFGIVLKHDY